MILNKFNNIVSIELRTWNRCAVYFNLMKDGGIECACRYLKSLDKQGISDMKIMWTSIVERGYDATKAAVVKNERVVRRAERDTFL